MSERGTLSGPLTFLNHPIKIGRGKPNQQEDEKICETTGFFHY